jgi:hypothetical protein
MDGMQAVFGKEWYKLRAGDIVTVKFIHAPSNSVIYYGKVTVEGA